MANPTFTPLFADTGAKTAVSDANYEGGIEAMTGGSYIPSATDVNWIRNERDKKLAYLDKRARQEWASDIDYLADEIVISSVNGKLYRALLNNTNKEPSANPTEWSLEVGEQATETLKGLAEIADQGETDAITDDTRFVTPLKIGFGFSALLAPNGYIKFPSWLGGWIVQWGHNYMATYTGTLVTFPLTFTSSVFTIVPAIINQDTPNCFITSITPSTFVISMIPAGTPVVNWVAIGN